MAPFVAPAMDQVIHLSWSNLSVKRQPICSTRTCRLLLPLLFIHQQPRSHTPRLYHMITRIAHYLPLSLSPHKTHYPRYRLVQIHYPLPLESHLTNLPHYLHFRTEVFDLALIIGLSTRVSQLHTDIPHAIVLQRIFTNLERNI